MRFVGLKRAEVEKSASGKPAAKGKKPTKDVTGGDGHESK